MVMFGDQWSMMGCLQIHGPEHTLQRAQAMLCLRHAAVLLAMDHAYEWNLTELGVGGQDAVPLA